MFVDPTVPANADGYPTAPPVVHCTAMRQLVRYTDPEQFNFFRDWINWCQNNNCNVRFDPDGTTIRWFGAYVLRIGDFLLDGITPITEDDVLFFLTPLPQWPENLDDVFGPVEEGEA